MSPAHVWINGFVVGALMITVLIDAFVDRWTWRSTGRLVTMTALAAVAIGSAG